MRVIRIGRDPKSDYVINHPMVSGNHADLYIFDNGAMQLVEHSTNGTYVDNMYIHNGTCFLRGSEVLVFPDQQPVHVSELLEVSVKADTSKPEDSAPKTMVHQESGAQDSGSSTPSSPVSVPGMSFMDTLAYYFNHYADFDGRARRQEYWYICLWNIIFSFVPIVNIVWAIATIIPSFAITARRLHDTNKSGWYMLLSFIPVIGVILILVWTLTDSDPYTNDYGDSPKYPSGLNQ